jgi:hypothetical protein
MWDRSGAWNSGSVGDTNVKVLWFATISSGASGTLAPPSYGTILTDQWGTGNSALASQITSGVPNFISPRTAAGVVVTATLDSLGNWTLSGTPSTYPVAVVYVYAVKLKYFNYAYALEIVELEPWASTVYVDASGFNKNLTTADVNVQHALATLDQLVIGGGGMTWSAITSDPNPAITQHGYLCDTSGGAFSVTLPASPSVGDVIGIADGAGTFDTNNLTIGRNGLNIMILGEDMTVRKKNIGFELVYDGASQGWRIA